MAVSDALKSKVAARNRGRPMLPSKGPKNRYPWVPPASNICASSMMTAVSPVDGTTVGTAEPLKTGALCRESGRTRVPVNGACGVRRCLFLLIPAAVQAMYGMPAPAHAPSSSSSVQMSNEPPEGTEAIAK